MQSSLFVFNFTSVRQPTKSQVKPKKPSNSVDKSAKPENLLIENTLPLELVSRHRKKDNHIDRYIKIIDKRYNESKMNAEYTFPRID
jgi:hypothetical protein